MASKQTISIILISIATFLTGYLVSLAFISTSIANKDDSYIWSDKKNIIGTVIEINTRENKILILLHDKQEKTVKINDKTEVSLKGTTKIEKEMRIKIIYGNQGEEINALFIKNLDTPSKTIDDDIVNEPQTPNPEITTAPFTQEENSYE